MSIISIDHNRRSSGHHVVTVVDDDGKLTRQITVPSPLPSEFATQVDFVKAQVRRMVTIIRSRKASADETAVEAAKFAGAGTDQDATGLLADLKAELDA